ncbi:helix-turn-helix transcriptional regulator [Streptomyces violaceoruber]|uniref:helix-turn-helix domain-containing protein n=1 Tax=Streptomyces violaceoruber TaxID=1935 RepID=UPI001F1B6D25|nr:helix-turn-helix transcriptional regulator [Streptomyces violaceoruber]MCF3170623.1 helix-turn-helix transcriptional regulator [Streptomyces violaceoruber]
MVNRRELNPDASPEAAYGARLRSAREARGWKQDELGLRCGYSGRHVSGVETGTKSPTRPFSIAIDGAFGFAGGVDSFEREWIKIKQGVLVQGFPEYVALEGGAAEIRMFEVGVIPGLLQTRAYAQALDRAAVVRGVITPEQADQRLALLMERQQALIRPIPPVIIAVLDESCIRRTVGGSAVMEAQLQHLADFAAQSHTMLQIAPFDIGERRPFNRAVNLLTLPDRSLVSYVESETLGHLDRELTSVLPVMRGYHQSQAASLSQAESVDVIHQQRKGIS